MHNPCYAVCTCSCLQAFPATLHALHLALVTVPACAHDAGQVLQS